jgi:hypothetical protein
LSFPAAADDNAALVEVTLSAPKLFGGTVQSLDASLERTRIGVADCVVHHGGMTSERGRLDMQFLVRERGRAEGVEVLRAQGVSEAASACVRKLFKNRFIGMPSDDPVGVSFSYKLKRGS